MTGILIQKRIRLLDNDDDTNLISEQWSYRLLTLKMLENNINYILRPHLTA